MFQFKQFVIRQDRTPMKVGTDGVLLGAWADLEQASTLLDIGTGTGLIALMGAQRNPRVRIEALEIEPEAIQQARENVSASPWSERIQVLPQALQAYFPSFQYDCIVCNPPFFSHSTPAPHPGRNQARHCDWLPHDELIQNVVRLLKPQGYFCVILPPQEAKQLILLADSYQLYPQKITSVLPNPGKAPKRYLMRFGFEAKPLYQDELIIEFSRHQYSPEYHLLTKDFYLNFND